MSCCCTHIITEWNPCCCGCVTTTSSTTTTTTCPGGETCEESFDPNCVIYNGPDLPCYGIKTGDSAADIMDIIIARIQCTTTTTTTVNPVSTTTSTTSSTTTTTSSTTTTTTVCPVSLAVMLGHSQVSAAEACAAVQTQYYVAPGCLPLDNGCKIYTDVCLTTEVDNAGGIGYYSDGTTVWEYSDLVGVVFESLCS